MTSAGSSGAKHSALIPTFPQRGKAPHQKPGCLPWPTRHWGKAGMGAGIQVSQQPPRRLAWCMRLTCRRCCVNGRRATCWPCRSPPRHCCHCTRCGTARLALQASVMDAVISPTGRSPDALVYLPLDFFSFHVLRRWPILFNMPTVLRIFGFRFHFYSDEGTEPPHIHVESGDGECKFWLSPVTLARNHGMSAVDIRKLERLVYEHQTF